MPRDSTCELETDACMEDVLNIEDLLVLPDNRKSKKPATSSSSSAAGDKDEDAQQQRQHQQQVVRSLAAMWDEERARRRAAGEPLDIRLPPEPPRDFAFTPDPQHASKIHELVLQENIDRKLLAAAEKESGVCESVHSQSPMFEETPPSNTPLVPDPVECYPEGAALTTQDREAVDILNFLHNATFTSQLSQDDQQDDGGGARSGGEDAGGSSGSDDTPQDVFDIMSSVGNWDTGRQQQQQQDGGKRPTCIPQLDGGDDDSDALVTESEPKRKCARVAVSSAGPRSSRYCSIFPDQAYSHPHVHIHTHSHQTRRQPGRPTHRQLDVVIPRPVQRKHHPQQQHQQQQPQQRQHRTHSTPAVAPAAPMLAVSPIDRLGAAERQQRSRRAASAAAPDCVSHTATRRSGTATAIRYPVSPAATASPPPATEAGRAVTMIPETPIKRVAHAQLQRPPSPPPLLPPLSPLPTPPSAMVIPDTPCPSKAEASPLTLPLLPPPPPLSPFRRPPPPSFQPPPSVGCQPPSCSYSSASPISISSCLVRIEPLPPQLRPPSQRPPPLPLPPPRLDESPEQSSLYVPPTVTLPSCTFCSDGETKAEEKAEEGDAFSSSPFSLAGNFMLRLSPDDNERGKEEQSAPPNPARPPRAVAERVAVPTTVALAFSWRPPARAAVLACTAKAESATEETVEYCEPFYSRPQHAPAQPFVSGGREIVVPVRQDPTLALVCPPRGAEASTQLQPFASRLPFAAPHLPPSSLPPFPRSGIMALTPLRPPPFVSRDVAPPKLKPLQLSSPSQIEVSPSGTVPDPRFPPQVQPKAAQQLNAAWHTNQHVTHLTLEIHVNSRGNLQPHPAQDAVQCICYSIHDDDAEAVSGDNYKHSQGVLILAADDFAAHSLGLDCRVSKYPNEVALLKSFVALVLSTDPDILSGYEIQQSSLGYLVERASHIGIDLCTELGRVRSCSAAVGQTRDDWSFSHSSGIAIAGRIVLNVWRILRNEVKSCSYSQSVMAQRVLGYREPTYPPRVLTAWFAGISMNAAAFPSPKLPVARERWRTVSHLLHRCELSLRLLAAQDVVGRTSELARVFGIDFYSVLTRGSQYRVESIVFRLTKPQNFILFSPSKQQVAQQRAPECVPLVMEPKSRMYPRPLLVMDFQSLYPSIIIGYNYCYSTCLGKVDLPFDTERNKRVGVTSLNIPWGLLSFLEKQLIVSPNGVMFVKNAVRQGVLPRMLQEILDTRVMIKGAMKAVSGNKMFDRMMNSRQLGLKMIANVTYGYTSATFSGRMPCVDIADAIVETARQTLERAINTVNSNPVWGAEVVYGDTDSMFVQLKSATREEAFQIGRDIAKTVTEQNPTPVRLQFEKVYHPCVLVSKKRYVGYKYESPDQQEGELDAKGIETVRRDTCPAVQKALTKCIKLLFETRDLSRVKDYLQQQWSHILTGKVNLLDFVFAKEVRLGTYNNKGLLPPAAIVSTRAMKRDPRTEPRYGERVPYVVVDGGPSARLADMVVSPETLFTAQGLRLNANYYITKQIIPAVERVIGLAGADVRTWYATMPRHVRRTVRGAQSTAKSKPRRFGYAAPPLPAPAMSSLVASTSTLEQYYRLKRCVACGGDTAATQAHGACCAACAARPAVAYTVVAQRANEAERQLEHLRVLCAACCRRQAHDIECEATDCPVLFERRKLEGALDSLRSTLDAFAEADA
eukprot:TRINITY_DN4137_c0_g1_i4.p1 TRINITY_DN4137_c0_g1~~TRINITY_DN4137_c0_g1_i4.p1  ORF type:complete len:1941 (-),score=416.30 TRINITY_DN4137_c0_g1_i4:61-5133(-)